MKLVYKILFIFVISILCFLPIKAKADNSVVKTWNFVDNYDSYFVDNYGQDSSSNYLDNDKLDNIKAQVMAYVNGNINSTDKKYYIVTYGKKDYNPSFATRYYKITARVYWFDDSNYNNINGFIYTINSTASQIMLGFDSGEYTSRYGYEYANFSIPINSTSSGSSTGGFSNPIPSSQSNFYLGNEWFESNIDNSILDNIQFTIGQYSGNDWFALNIDSNTFNLNDTINLFSYFTEEVVNVPVITLNGDSTIYVDEYSTYSDLGATAYDQEDGDITDDITILSNLNTSVPGEYQVTYEVCDSGNNCVQAVRTVIVRDNYTKIYMKDNYKRIIFWYKDYRDLLSISYATYFRVNGTYLYKMFDITSSLESYSFGHIKDINNENLKAVSNIKNNLVLFGVPIGSWVFDNVEELLLGFDFFDNEKTAWFFDPNISHLNINDYYIDVDLTYLDYAIFDYNYYLVYSSKINSSTGEYEISYDDDGIPVVISPIIKPDTIDVIVPDTILGKITSSLNYFRSSILMLFGFVSYLYLSLPVTFQIFILAMLGITFIMFLIGIFF